MTTYATPNFGMLRLTGPDAIKFLQGYTTCDLAPVTAGGASVGAICNLKGRMVTSFRVAMFETDLLLRMHRALVPKTIAFLSKYIVFSKAEMHDASEQWLVGGLTTTNVQRDAVKPMDTGLEVGLGGDRAELWSRRPIQAEEDSDAWHRLDIYAGLAWISPETAGEYLPQMFAYDALGAVDFEKGCYLGQEIVARAHFRGTIKRRIYRAGSSAEVPLGAPLWDGNREVGQVVASAPAATGQGSELLIVGPAETTGQLSAETAAGTTTVTVSRSIHNE